MLISGGKVIAIDKVLHDNTLSGDGRFVKLGVNSSQILTTDAATEMFQPKGNYVDRSILKQYYTIFDADAKFATIAGVYSKREADSKFQEKGNYATTADVDALNINLNAFKYDVFKTYQTITGADAKFATKNELNNQYTTISNQTDYKIDAVRTQISDLTDNFVEHIDDNDRHINAEVNDFLKDISGTDFNTFINTSGLNKMPTGKQYAVFNIGNGVWTWVETQGGGGGITNIVAETPLSAKILDTGDGYQIGMELSASRAIEEADRLLDAYTIAEGRGITIEDDDTVSATRISTNITNITITETIPEERENLEVYFQTMTAELVDG